MVDLSYSHEFSLTESSHQGCSYKQDGFVVFPQVRVLYD